ncbi:MAG: gamma-butyrobetaine hydroxylase-like domain-containing protein, partial [Nocardioides sp.]|nr:gamma-butyrobetaine hydroxylase-like domain-containing protein [Nocardioides sp.]
MFSSSPELADSTHLASATGLVLKGRYLSVSLSTGTSAFHYVWLRDNCGCAGCRVAQSGERQLITADIREDIAPVAAEVDAEGVLRVAWNDGHASSYTSAWLSAYDYSAPGRKEPDEPRLWDSGLSEVPTFEHDDVVGTVAGQLAYLDAMRNLGVALVRGTPSRDGEVARFAEAMGHVRETTFERIHNVRHDPTGYNVAHTALELKPHTDLPSYHWPPSVQLLHFLVNDA